MIKEKLKTLYLRLLYLFPHNNIYEFHHVSDAPSIDLSPRKLNTDRFYSFVDAHGPYISLEEITRKKELNRCAAITFDDGLEDVYSIAYPFLKERKIPFTAFVLSEKLDQPGYITTEQLLEMAADPLVTIGSHGTDHTKLSQADEAKQRIELVESKKQLESILHKPCDYFAYPFGMYNDTTLRIAREAGYKNAYAVKGRPLLRWNQKEQYALPRLSIEDHTLVFYSRA